ncbi:hypothetical protein [Sulfuricurvum sp.]|uniref:hypothetical protein n=1 Tax=Sulfuricurvum sp. TaxID=2025608 RepID=UPI00261404E1|nr:hypothetical protein [Sulfuricurvum sp.]MDD2267754.1 hypothetical protein [Sulfuricurvum sp.]MDD2783704.1 hypothetical protein [Sulfuricurvum sp.]
MKKGLSALFLASSLWGYGEGVIYWAPHMSHGGGHSQGKHGGHGMGEVTMLHAMNLDGNGSVTLITPDLSKDDLNLTDTALTLPKATIGGYYALVLTHRSENQVDSAIRYLSQQGRPSKISPTKLTALPKTDLEIVPDPLHREHDRYTASKSYHFVLRLHNHPLANTTVFLETRNTPAQSVITDAEGKFTVTLPNDFKNVQIGRSENKPSEFLLTTQHREGDTLYKNTLTMPYSLNPNDYWQSQPYGAGAIFIGFLGGLFFYRRHKKNQGVSRG